MRVSLFAYENPQIAGLFTAWAEGREPVLCLVPEERSLADVSQFFGVTECRAGDRFLRGRLSVHVLPFLSQPDYDRLLQLCDLNFVRGEDSFVRAQWAERPLVWHIYPQSDAAHQVKLDAFLDRYLAGLPEPVAEAARHFWNAWNDHGDAGSCWPAFKAVLPSLHEHARPWAQEISAGGDLAGNLVRFAAKPLAQDHEAG